MKTILTLKLTMSMFILISLMSFTTVASITPSDDYKSFQKNVEPKNAVFVQLNILDYSDKEQKTGDFYTIYKPSTVYSGLSILTLPVKSINLLFKS